MSDDGIGSALAEIATLLQKYRLGPLSAVVELARLWPDEIEQFRELALDDVIWGGAGSLCDTSLLSVRHDDAAFADQRRLWEAIIRLGEGMDALGLADDRVRETTILLGEVNQHNFGH